MERNKYICTKCGDGEQCEIESAMIPRICPVYKDGQNFEYGKLGKKIYIRAEWEEKND